MAFSSLSTTKTVLWSAITVAVKTALTSKEERSVGVEISRKHIYIDYAFGSAWQLVEKHLRHTFICDSETEN